MQRERQKHGGMKRFLWSQSSKCFLKWSLIPSTLNKIYSVLFYHWKKTWIFLLNKLQKVPPFLYLTETRNIMPQVLQPLQNEKNNEESETFKNQHAWQRKQKNAKQNANNDYLSMQQLSNYYTIHTLLLLWLPITLSCEFYFFLLCLSWFYVWYLWWLN